MREGGVSKVPKHIFSVSTAIAAKVTHASIP